MGGSAFANARNRTPAETAVAEMYAIGRCPAINYRDSNRGGNRPQFRKALQLIRHEPSFTDSLRPPMRSLTRL